MAALVKGDVPLVLTIRGLDARLQDKQKFFQPFATFALRQADRIIALGSDLKRQAATQGCKESKIITMNVGVNMQRFKPLDKVKTRKELKLADVFTVLYVGNLIKLKRVDAVIRCFSEVCMEHDMQLVIIGKGPEEDRLKTIASSYGCSGKISFKGYISYSNIPSYVASADVLMLLSESEGLPGCIQEAFACGVPVIATAVGGIADLVINNENGFLVQTWEEARDHLKDMVTDQDLSSRLGTKAYRFSQNNLSLERIASDLDDLYKSLIKEGSQSHK
jgi:glycosyltransferase involved in cell wall biosynthesis